MSNGGNLFAAPASPNQELIDRTVTPGVEPSGRSSSPVLLIRDEHDHHNNLLIEAIRNDRLRQFEKDKIHHVEWCILTSAKLIAPFIDTTEPNGTSSTNLLMQNNSVQNNCSGYDWCLEQIRRMGSMSSMNVGSSGLNYNNLADELELYKAVRHLRAREFDKAIATLKTFERKDKLISGRTSSRTATSASSLQNRVSSSGSATTPTLGPRVQGTSVTSSRVSATAATNLSFLYLLQQDMDMAARYADEAISINRYCLGALLNKANYFYHQGEYQRAIELYQEVINNNTTRFEAYFNMSLAGRKLGNFEKALDSLFRLRTITKIPTNQSQNVISQKINNTIEINLLYQIGLMLV